MQSYVAIQKILERDQPWGPRDDLQALACPVCGDTYHHWRTPHEVPGNDNYEAGWPGRGNLLVIPIDGECGHYWELCLGSHKGDVAIFARYYDKGGYPNGTRP